MTTLDDLERLERAIKRCADRFRVYHNRMFWSPYAGKNNGDRAKLRAWYDWQMADLHRAYVKALNECDQVIGKQYHWDTIRRRYVL